MIALIRKPKDKRSRPSRERGFTLVEMLVVITIIGLITSPVGPRVLNYLGESKIKAARIQIQSFASALDLFYLDTGRYPSTAEGLTALVKPPGGMTAWNVPYLRGGNVPNDPWGRPYIYRSPGERDAYEIISYGSDGQEGGTGTAADISSKRSELRDKPAEIHATQPDRSVSATSVSRLVQPERPSDQLLISPVIS